MPEPRSDDALMVEAAGGRQAAFGELVRRYEGRVRRFCGCLLRSEEEAREAAQEVFLKLWTSRSRYRSGGRFEALLFTIARNHCRSILRRRRVVSWLSLSESEDAAPALAVAPDVHGQLERLGEAARVQRALARLPDKFRVPLVLRFCEELDYDVIAEVIGRTPSTARSRVHYGLKALEGALRREATA